MFVIKITEKGGAQMARQIETTPQRLQGAFATALARSLEAAIPIVQQQYLSGPRPGKIQSVSGRLRGSIRQEVESSGDVIRGRIGTNVKYAAFHELGFHGVENVKAHTRVVGQVLGGTEGETDSRKRVVSDTGRFLGFRESRKRASGRQRSGFVEIQFVRAHTRRINYAGKPFLRPVVEQSLPVILENNVKAELDKL